jgi:methylenetetrahydrofolate--tRNA-(uracil-5-)-methyltransferase
VNTVSVIGGGLAGCEAALQLARRGVRVELFEMRPHVMTPAHETDRLAELVCSNSFKSASPTHASGLLKSELARLGSALLAIAEQCRVEAGTALAVDRDQFASAVTESVCAHPLIKLRREEVHAPPPAGEVILASGPLTSERLAAALAEIVGEQRLFFYDATAPIVDAVSLDTDVLFAANRREAGEGHYLNCPFNREQYETFVTALLDAERFPLREFESASYFESCLPIDELARRGRDTLRFGPMRPVGLVDPRTGRRPYAVVQLRPENRAATAYNLVGFQNRLRHDAQRRVLRLIPGLEHARFFRLGRIHRNTYLDAPRLLDAHLWLLREPRLTVAGQLTGLEGYVEAIATGLLAGIFTASRLAGREMRPPPPETAVGALLEFVSGDPDRTYRPTNINYGLFPPLEQARLRGRERARAIGERATQALRAWNEDVGACVSVPEAGGNEVSCPRCSSGAGDERPDGGAGEAGSG